MANLIDTELLEQFGDEELGFKKDRIGQRLRRGWDVEKALTTPV